MAELGDGKRLDHMVAVGRTTPTSVRIWLRAKNPGVHRLRIRRATTGKEVAVVDFTVPAAPDLDLTHAVTYPDDFAGAVLLDPLTVYRFDVARVAGRAKVGEGRFETGPSTPADTPDRFSIAVMSCHQPFASDGELDPEHMRVFEVLETILNRNEAKLAILGGDQMYSDAPKRCSVLYPHYLRQAWGKDSILAYSTDEVRAIYQDRYRAFWALPELQALYASHTTYPILDDHEIIDDWGADPAHADPSHVSLLAGAREAYFDYQGSRVQPRAAALPPSFHYDFDYGSVGIFVMDVRSERWVVPGQNQLYGGTQLQDLQRFLQRSDDKRLLLLVTSVPIVHIPEWLADAGYDMVGSKVDFGDHWSLKDNVPARDRLLALLLAHQASHPQQRIVLVGGDVHIACALEIAFPGLPPMYQFTSSAISNRLSPFEGWAGSQGPRRVPELGAQGPSGVQRAAVSPVRRLKGENPFGGPNVGIIEIDAAADPLRFRFQLWSYDKKGTKRLLAVQKFVSQWVG